jgi:hypothetical protein
MKKYNPIKITPLRFTNQLKHNYKKIYTPQIIFFEKSIALARFKTEQVH